MKNETKMSQINEAQTAEMSMTPAARMSQDLKTSILLVSVHINLVLFTVWVALQVTTQFDQQIATLLFTR